MHKEELGDLGAGPSDPSHIRHAPQPFIHLAYIQHFAKYKYVDRYITAMYFTVQSKRIGEN
jgi:hypothetical protein